MRFQNELLCVALMAAASLAQDTIEKPSSATFNGKCFQCLSNKYNWCESAEICIDLDETKCADDSTPVTGLTKCGEPEAPAEGFGCPATTILKDDAVYPVIESGAPVEGDSFLKSIVKMGPG